MYSNLYEGLNSTEQQIIHNKRREILDTSLSSKTETIETYYSLNWAAIYNDYLANHGKHIKMYSTNAYYTQSDIDDYYPNNMEASLNFPFDIQHSNNYYQIIFVQTSTGVKIYDYAKQLADLETSWEKVPYADRLLVQHQKHRIRVLKLTTRVIILTNELNNRLVQETLAMFPSLFNIEELQQDDNIKECCRAVINKQPIRPYFENIFNNIEKEKKQKFEKSIKDLLTAGKRTRLIELENNITRINNSIKDYIDSLDNYYERLQSQLNEKLGLESTLIENPESLQILLNFLYTNEYIKSAQFIDANIGSGYKELLLLELEAPITLYETEPLERIFNNLKHEFSSTGEMILESFKEIFLEEKYQLYCTTYVAMDIPQAKFNADSRYNTKQFSDYTRMTQPHLTFFNCWGDSEHNIRKALREDDILGAIQLMLIAIRNINFTDTTVLRGWINRIINSNALLNVRCIKDQEGNWYSLKELNQKRIEEAPVVGTPEIIDELEGHV